MSRTGCSSPFNVISMQFSGPDSVLCVESWRVAGARVRESWIGAIGYGVSLAKSRDSADSQVCDTPSGESDRRIQVCGHPHSQ